MIRATWLQKIDQMLHYGRSVVGEIFDRACADFTYFLTPPIPVILRAENHKCVVIKADGGAHQETSLYNF
jgi:hypothetical protein